MRKLTSKEVEELANRNGVNANHVKGFFKQIYMLPNWQYWDRSRFVDIASRNQKMYRYNRETYMAIIAGIDKMLNDGFLSRIW